MLKNHPQPTYLRISPIAVQTTLGFLVASPHSLRPQSLNIQNCWADQQQFNSFWIRMWTSPCCLNNETRMFYRYSNWSKTGDFKQIRSHLWYCPDRTNINLAIATNRFLFTECRALPKHHKHSSMSVCPNESVLQRIAKRQGKTRALFQTKSSRTKERRHANRTIRKALTKPRQSSAKCIFNIFYSATAGPQYSQTAEVVEQYS